MESLLVRIKSWYLQFSLIVFLVFSMLLIIELASGLIIKNISFSKVAEGMSDDELKLLYPNHTIQEINGILNESWQPDSFIYTPFVEYSNREYKGKFVNIQKNGYRSPTELPWPPPQNSVFFFGGSTCLGTGVADSETISAYAASLLKDDYVVYNFCTPAQFSTIERIRFFNFISQGIKPAIAIFIDGVNDFIFYQVPDRSNFSNRLEVASHLNLKYMIKKAISNLNTVKLILTLKNRSPDEIVFRSKATKDEIDKAVTRLTRNREIINSYCKNAGIKCLFVTQPAPTFEYDNNKRPIKIYPEKFKSGINCKDGYQLIESHYKSMPLKNHLFLGRLQCEEPVYVDTFHYSTNMNKKIAYEIVGYLNSVGIN